MSQQMGVQYPMDSMHYKTDHMFNSENSSL